jgi:hypothetical protein
MLTPELEKLKRVLQGEKKEINETALLNELLALENIEVGYLCESLSLSKKVCRTCGKPL